MVVLGFDPGTATTGYGVVEHVKGKSYPISYGTIETHPSSSDASRLKKIFESAKQLIESFTPQALSIEKLFFNKNTRTAMTVGQARGVLMLAGAQCDTEIYEYTPLQIKLAIVGSGSATKSQVQYMVKQILKMQTTPKPDDAADALAVAICYLHTTNFERAAAR